MRCDVNTEQGRVCDSVRIHLNNIAVINVNEWTEHMSTLFLYPNQRHTIISIHLFIVDQHNLRVLPFREGGTESSWLEHEDQ